MLFSLASVNASAGLRVPDMRHIECISSSVMASRNQYLISNIVSIFSFMRLTRNLSQSTKATTRIYRFIIDQRSSVMLSSYGNARSSAMRADCSVEGAGLGAVELCQCITLKISNLSAKKMINPI